VLLSLLANSFFKKFFFIIVQNLRLFDDKEDGEDEKDRADEEEEDEEDGEDGGDGEDEEDGDDGVISVINLLLSIFFGDKSKYFMIFSRGKSDGKHKLLTFCLNMTDVCSLRMALRQSINKSVSGGMTTSEEG